MKKKILIGLGITILVVMGGWTMFKFGEYRGQQSQSVAQSKPQVNHLPHTSAPLPKIQGPRPPGYEMFQPDALIATQSLAELPKDFRSLPVFKDILTEDLFFYYEQHPGRLSLEGTLRRLAFEHELTLTDQVLAHVFNTPAKVALWKGGDGKLDQYLMLLDQGGLIRILEFAVKLALTDSQLKQAGTVPLSTGDLPVYELRYSRQNRLFFASYKDKLFISSDRELLLPKSSGRQTLIKEWLAEPDPGARFMKEFNLDSNGNQHTIAVSAHYFSFGYQRFFPSLTALRFDFSEGQWTGSILMDKKMASTQGLWQMAPTGAALCAAIPVDSLRMQNFLTRLIPWQESEKLMKALDFPISVCWYREAKLYAPLIIVKTKGECSESTLKNLFERSIGTHEAGIPPPPQEQPDTAQEQNELAEDHPPDSAQQNPPPSRKSYYPPFGVTETRTAEGFVWQREVSSRYGSRSSAESLNREKMRSGEFFTVTMARWKDVLLFSPDGRRVENAIATLEKRYPALVDSLPANLELSILMYPEHLADLLRTSVLDSLPEPEEGIFRQSVAARLLPALNQFKQWPAYGLVTPQGTANWEKMVWQSLAAH